MKTKRTYTKPSATVITIDFGSSLLAGSERYQNQIKATTEDVESDTPVAEDDKEPSPFYIFI